MNVDLNRKMQRKINRDSGARPEWHCVYIHLFLPRPMAITASVLEIRISGYLFFERLTARGSRLPGRFFTGLCAVLSSSLAHIFRADLVLGAHSIRPRQIRSSWSVPLKLKSRGGEIVGSSRLPHHPAHQVVAL